MCNERYRHPERKSSATKRALFGEDSPLSMRIYPLKRAELPPFDARCPPPPEPRPCGMVGPVASVPGASPACARGSAGSPGGPTRTRQILGPAVDQQNRLRPPPPRLFEPLDQLFCRSHISSGIRMPSQGSRGHGCVLGGRIRVPIAACASNSRPGQRLDIERLNATEQWTTGFEPVPLTYLNQRTSEDHGAKRNSSAREQPLH